MDRPNVADDELVAAFRASGDRDVFEALAARHLPLIRRLLLVLLNGHREDSEDAEQEVLVRLYLNLGKFAHRSEFTTYLTRLVRNTAIDEIRKHERHRRISKRLVALTPIPERRDEASQPLIEAIGRTEVTAALEGLSSEERFVLYMKDGEGWSLDQIARTIKRPIGTVKSKLFRSRKKFAERYRDICDE